MAYPIIIVENTEIEDKELKDQETNKLRAALGLPPMKTKSLPKSPKLMEKAKKLMEKAKMWMEKAKVLKSNTNVQIASILHQT